MGPFFFIWACLALLSGFIADRKGYSFALWTFIGAFSGPFGVIGAFILPVRRTIKRVTKAGAKTIPESVRRSQERIAEQERELRRLSDREPDGQKIVVGRRTETDNR